MQYLFFVKVDAEIKYKNEREAEFCSQKIAKNKKVNEQKGEV